MITIKEKMKMPSFSLLISFHIYCGDGVIAYASYFLGYWREDERYFICITKEFQLFEPRIFSDTV